jgi:RNA-directed DNA polymerase
MRRYRSISSSQVYGGSCQPPPFSSRQISAFVEHYNHVRYHESLSNLTPADVYFGIADTILAERERIKRATIAARRLQHRLQAA